MKMNTICVFALAMTTVTGLATAQAATEPESNQPELASPRIDEFTPMTRKSRLRHYLTGTFGRNAMARNAMRAELGQIAHSPKEWGRDGGGFATRVASGFGQHFVRKTLEYGASTLLHEDNRYLRSERKGFRKRTVYAVTSTFLTRRDNGRRSFAFSRFGSTGGASFISRAWMPHSIATMGAGASSFGIAIGVDIGSNMLREFWPDLKRHFRRS